MKQDERSYTERFKTPEKGSYKFNEVPLDDPRVYAMIASGRTQGCFQIESKLGKDWSTGLKPSNIEEISDLIALIRPGCLESGMTETYKNVRRGNQEVEYYHPSLEPILKDTKGVLVYQEQMIKIAIELAGFSESEADTLRKGIGKKDPEIMLKMQKLFAEKAETHGIITKEQAEEIFSWILKSVRYSFNKCVSGKEKILRYSYGHKKFNPTIEELYKIKNNVAYAKQTGYFELHKKYSSYGNYGMAMSLTKDCKITHNIIKDIRYEGKREVFLIVLENGKTIKCTDNHKFPTPNGEKRLFEIKIGEYLYTVGKKSEGYKSYPVLLSKITNIKSIGAEDVYDIEMEAPNHNFVVESGIVTCNSHSVSYGMTTYWTTYAKVHYPTEFFCSYLMFSDLKPDPKEEIYTVINEAKSFNIDILRPRIELGNKDFKIIGNKQIAFGLYHIRDVGENTISEIIRLKDSLKDSIGFIKNIPEIGRKAAEALIKSGACDSYGIERTTLLKIVNVIYGYSTKDSEKNLNLKCLSHKELDYLNSNLSQIDGSLKQTIINHLLKMTQNKGCMTKRIPVILNKIDQLNKTAKDTNLLKSAWEKVYLGVNVTCSAADDIDKDDGLNCKQVFDLDPIDYGIKFKVYCTIDKVYEKITGANSKTPNKKYCYLDVSDSNLRLDGVVCWPEQYEKYSNIISENALICLHGRCSRYKDKKQFTVLEIKEIFNDEKEASSSS